MNTDSATPSGYGTQHGGVFMMSPSRGGWTFQSIYTFPEYGGGPAGQLLRDSAGNLYGTTIAGGSNPLGHCSNGCGRIFKLTVPLENLELSERTGIILLS